MELKDSIAVQSIDQLIEIQAQKSPYILYISTVDCNVCKAIYPKMMNLVQDTKIPVYSIDASVTPEISGQLLVFSVPTIILVDQQREVYRESRFIQFDEFKQRLEWVNQA